MHASVLPQSVSATTRFNRLTKLQNSSQLLLTTPLPPVSFERYHSIIVIDSNRNPCYPIPCFPCLPWTLKGILTNHSPLPLPSAHSASLRSALLPRLSTSNCRLSIPSFTRVRINIIPRHLTALRFHTLAHSFATRKTLTLAFSIISALLAQNTRGVWPCSHYPLSTGRGLARNDAPCRPSYNPGFPCAPEVA